MQKMRKLVFFLVPLVFLAFLAMGEDKPEQKQPQHAYMGMKKCSMCHKGEKKGMIFEKWQEGPHAKAFTVLASEEALKVYKGLGKEGNPQSDAACLRCHVTGYGIAAELTANLLAEEGITCESCHGAGADYGKITVMKDKAAAIAAGMVEKPAEMCVSCHNAESPTFKEFKFEERWAKITHSLPKESSE